MDWITEQLPLDNEFFAGGLMLSLMVALWQTLRGLPSRIWPYIQRRILFTVTIDSAYTDARLGTIGVWLERNGYGHKVGHAYYDSWSGSLTPGNVTIWVKYKGHFLMVKSGHEQESTSNGSRTRKTVSVTGLKKSREMTRKFVAEVQGTPSELQEGKTRVITRGVASDTDCWITSRTPDSLSLPACQFDTILADVRQFMDSESEYQALGIPYHRCWLFQGPPGTGKTSVVRAIATEINSGITVINGLGDFEAQRFIGELNNAVHANQIILIEDVDAIDGNPTRIDHDENQAVAGSDQKRERMTMSLADMLNALDGISTPSGMMLFLTTNHPEKINQRLLRPSRVDHVTDFAALDAATAVAMTQRFMPDDPELVNEVREMQSKQPMTPAELQSILMRMRFSKHTG